MGINDRDYVRENDAPIGFAFGSEYPTVRNLIVVTAVVFLLQMLIVRPIRFDEMERAISNNPEAVAQSLLDATIAGGEISVPQEWLELNSVKVLKGQVWRLLTTGFCHTQISLYPIIINLVILFWLGRRLESRFGSRQFLWMYLTAILISSLAFVGLLLIRGQHSSTLGGAGAITAVMALYALCYPHERVNLFGMMPIPIPVFVALFVLYDLSPLFGDELWLPTSVGHLSHLFGLAYGFVFWKTGHSIGSLIPHSLGKGRGRLDQKRGNAPPSKDEPAQALRAPRTKREKRFVDATELGEEVDRILAKISDSGRGSLTTAELSTLEEASKHYSQRS